MITLENFFNSVGLYRPQVITLFEQDKLTNVYFPTNDLLELPSFFSPKKGTIVTKCKYCGERMPFSISTLFNGRDLLIESTEYSSNGVISLKLGDYITSKGGITPLKLYLTDDDNNSFFPTMEVKLAKKDTASFYATFFYVQIR